MENSEIEWFDRREGPELLNGGKMTVLEKSVTAIIPSRLQFSYMIKLAQDPRRRFAPHNQNRLHNGVIMFAFSLTSRSGGLREGDHRICCLIRESSGKLGMQKSGSKT